MKKLLVAITALALLLSACANNGATQPTEAPATEATASPSATPEAKPEINSTGGIDAGVFDAQVKSEINTVDAAGVIGKVETSMDSENPDIAYVKLYLKNMVSWELTDTEKKEFIHTMGAVMDDVGYFYNSKSTIQTEIYSPDGLLLGTRTLLGETKLADQ